MMPPGWLGSLAHGFCLTDEGVWSSRLGLFAACAAQTFAGEFDAMGVVDEAIQDRVGVGGVAYRLMPAIHGKLGRDDSGAASVSLLEDFEQVVAGARVERLKARVAEDQQIGSAKGFQHAGMAPVAARQGEVFAEFGPAVIENRAIVAAGFVADGAGEPALANAGRTDEDQIVVGVDPGAVGELLEQGAVEPRGLQ
jgi:hypothetical protein